MLHFSMSDNGPHLRYLRHRIWFFFHSFHVKYLITKPHIYIYAYIQMYIAAGLLLLLAGFDSLCQSVYYREGGEFKTYYRCLIIDVR